jgi:hypothetical protein
MLVITGLICIEEAIFVKLFYKLCKVILQAIGSERPLAFRVTNQRKSN